MLFPMALSQSEMQTVPSRICSSIANSISYDDNRYVMHASNKWQWYASVIIPCEIPYIIDNIS